MLQQQKFLNLLTHAYWLNIRLLKTLSLSKTRSVVYL